MTASPEGMARRTFLAASAGAGAAMTSSRLIIPMAAMPAAIFGSASAQETFRQQEPPPSFIPDDISVGRATIWSEGTRMAADIYSPKGAVGKLPTIIMAYGWGGTMERFRAEGAAFARAGYLVVMFDYRGWGESDSRVILAAPEPTQRPGNRFTAEVIELREILDPLAEVTDLSNVIHWVQAEPQSDTSRIGIWGTSFGGGIAAYVAGHDHRVKALHAQVAPLELRALDPLGYQDGTKRARGELGYPKPGIVVVSGLRGAPIAEHFLPYSPSSHKPRTGLRDTDCTCWQGGTVRYPAHHRCVRELQRHEEESRHHPGHRSLRCLRQGARRSAAARARMVR
jgi:uncharacterized protein